MSMWSDTNPKGGDSDNNLLSKIAQAQSAVAGANVTSVNGLTGAVVLAIPTALANFLDETADADAVIYHTGGTVEALRVIGATGFVQLTTARFHRTASTDLLAFLGGSTKSNGAFCELYGQDHPTGLGGATFSIHDGGNFRLRSAPTDSTASVLRWQIVGTTGNIEHTPVWADAGTVFRAVKIDVVNNASAANSRLTSWQVATVEQAWVDKDGTIGSIKNMYLTGGSASDGWFGQSSANSYVAINNGGIGGIRGSSNFFIQIDSNGDQGDREFGVYHDSSAPGGGTPLFRVFETGNATLTNNLTLVNAVMGQSVLTYAGTVDVDFDLAANRTLALTGDVIFTTSNRAAGKSEVVKILCDGSDRGFTFPATWIFIGAAAPATIAAGKTAILSLICFGTTDADVLAVYTVEP